MTLAEKIRPAFALVDSKPKWMSRIDNIPYDKEIFYLKLLTILKI